MYWGVGEIITTITASSTYVLTSRAAARLLVLARAYNSTFRRAAATFSIMQVAEMLGRRRTLREHLQCVTRDEEQAFTHGLAFLLRHGVVKQVSARCLHHLRVKKGGGDTSLMCECRLGEGSGRVIVSQS